MAGRTAYACETCQPLALGAGEQLAAGRSKALGAAKQAKVGWEFPLWGWELSGGRKNSWCPGFVCVFWGDGIF